MRRTETTTALSTDPGGLFVRMLTVVLMVSSGSPSALADDISPALNLSRAVTLALEQEPGLGAVRARQSAAEAEAALAATGWRPSLS